jgi:hypothetical protein
MESNLFKIRIDNGKELVRDVLRRNEHPLSKEIVSKICDAMDKNETYVEIAEIITPAEIITIHSTSPNFLTTLESNLETLVKYEEYEVCAIAVKHIDLLKERKNQRLLENNLED